MRFWLFLFSQILVCGVAFAQSAVEGFWRTADGDAVVEIYPCEETMCGRFVWLKVDSMEEPSLDEKNKNTDLRGRPLCGLTFMGAFRNIQENRWGGGWIYSPRHGQSFSAELSMSDADTLTLRGYVFLPVFGGDQTWKRVHAPELCWLLANR